MIRWGLISLSLCTWLLLQDVRAGNNFDPDSSKIFSMNDLRELVMQHNPVVKQAGLLSDAARTRVTQALGSFDPKLDASFDRKQFGGKDYYNRWTSELKVPLWLAGADLKIGFDRNVAHTRTPKPLRPSPGWVAWESACPLVRDF